PTTALTGPLGGGCSPSRAGSPSAARMAPPTATSPGPPPACTCCCGTAATPAASRCAATRAPWRGSVSTSGGPGTSRAGRRPGGGPPGPARHRPAKPAGPALGPGVLARAGLVRRQGLARAGIVQQRRGDEEIRARPVAGDRDVPDHRDPQQRLDVVIVRLRLQRVPEEHQQVDLAVRDPGADLLVAAQPAAAEADDGQAEILVEQAPGGTGGVQAVPGEDAAGEAGPLPEGLFPAAVCD